LRVGRQGDPCKRFRIKGLAVVDVDEEILYKRKLNSFLEDHFPSPVLEQV
jgi:hypothetical protein